MSKIIKKITKKYKWLRFLNRKVTKLSVLGASLVGLCISSGASFAKYRDENYGNGNAGIATMGDVVVSYIETGTDNTIQLPSIGKSTDGGWHAFIATIKVQFFNVEVKQNFNITFKISNSSNSKYSDTSNVNDTSFYLPASLTSDDAKNITTYVKTSSDSEATETAVTEAVSDNNNREYKNGWEKYNYAGDISTLTGYYGVEETTNSGALSSDYEFKSEKWTAYKDATVLNNLALSFTTKNETVLPTNETTIFFYKLLFFVNFEVTGNKIDAEESKIFYEINGWQVQ